MLNMDLNENVKTLDSLFGELSNLEETDQSAIDAIISYYEELNDEAENFMAMLVKQLEFAAITWEQPWYQESNCITRPFKNCADNSDDNYNTGTMTKDEIDKIEKNWHRFVKRFNVPDKLVCLARWRNKDKKKPEEKARVYAVAFLARGLKRNLVQVYSHIVSYYGGHNKGHYTMDEEKVMKICFHHCPKKAPIILSAVLARERRGIYKRFYSTLNGNPPKRKNKWTLQLASKLVKLLMESTGEPLEGLKNKHIDKAVWIKLEEKFHKNCETLQHFWNVTLHCQLFIKCWVTIRKVRRNVFKVLRSSNYKIWRDIRWKEVLNKFPDGFTTTFLYWTTIRLFKGYKQYSKVPLQELVDYGLERMNSKAVRARNKRLRTLVLNSDGLLEVKYYDEKLRVTSF